MFLKDCCALELLVLCITAMMVTATSATQVNLGSTTIHPLSAERRIKYTNSTDRKTWIIGGQFANIRDFPFIVSIQSFSSTWYHSCGGSILNARIILTACHCVYSRRFPLRLTSPLYTRIVAGDQDLRYVTQFRQVRRAKRFVPHPNCGNPFNGADLYHDIAAITLYSPLTFTIHVQPVKIFSTNARQAHFHLSELARLGAECSSPGWGLVNFDPDISDPRLKYTRKRLMTSQACRATLCRYGQVFCIDYDRFDQVCAFGYDSSVCSGDSGGPLICSGYLFASVSYGVFCGRGVPQVYSNIIPILYFVNNAQYI